MESPCELFQEDIDCYDHITPIVIKVQPPKKLFIKKAETEPKLLPHSCKEQDAHLPEIVCISRLERRSESQGRASGTRPGCRAVTEGGSLLECSKHVGLSVKSWIHPAKDYSPKFLCI